jgi:predicted nuclease of predicted toxin-antitoxin system
MRICLNVRQTHCESQVILPSVLYEVGLRAKKDPAIFAYACRHGLIIITRDADFLTSQYRPPHPGLILLSLPGVPGRAVVDPLMVAITILRDQDLSNTVYLIDQSGLKRVG